MDFEGYNYRGFYENPWNNFTIDNEKGAKKLFFRLFLSVSIYIIAANIASLLLQITIILIFSEARATEIYNNGGFILLQSAVCSYIIALPLLLLTLKGTRGTVRYKTKMGFKEFLGFFFAGEFLMIIGSFISSGFNYILSIFKLSSDSETLEQALSTAPVFITLIMTVVVAPIAEEFIFRKLFMDRLGVYGDRLAIVVSAAAFGLFHGNISQFFYSALLGLVLGYVYSKTGRIIYPILLHGAINLFSAGIPLAIQKIEVIIFNYLAPFLPAGWENMDYDALMQSVYNAMLENSHISTEMLLLIPLSLIGMALSLSTIAVSAIGFFIFMKNIKKVYVSDRCDVLIPKERRMGLIFKNAGVLIFIGVSLVIFFLNSELFADALKAVSSAAPAAGGV